MTYTTVTATNGTEFRLLKTKMSSMHLDPDGIPTNRHWAHRSAVRASLQTGAGLQTGGPYCGGQTPQEYWGEHSWDVLHGRNRVEIGCMTFSGRAYLTLRKWALSR